MNTNDVRTHRTGTREATRSDVALARSIAEGIASRWGCEVTDIYGPSHRPEHTGPRNELYASLWGSGWSLSRIARTLHRTHTTVKDGIQRDLGLPTRRMVA